VRVCSLKSSLKPQEVDVLTGGRTPRLTEAEKLAQGHTVDELCS
jgi:hypothetical protein